MITCKLQGGLGNQLFQVSTAYALALRNSDNLVINPNNHHPSYINGANRHITQYINNIFRNIEFANIQHISEIYREPEFSYSEIAYEKDMLIEGYFQSEKYFVDCREELLNLFSIDKQNKAYILQNYGDILKGLTVSIHVRRGDYIKYSDIHPICTKDYYIKAMAAMPSNALYLVFSDDIEWCLRNFTLNQFKIIDEDDIISLYLMSMCNHHILANSSFSWWGAWLNSDANKRVVVPKKWFGASASYSTKDLIPDGWNTI